MILKPTGAINLAVTRDMQVENTNNLYVLCQTNAGAITINLPRISSIAGVPNSTWGFRIFVTDDKNNAAVNNITIVPNPADKINGSAAPIVLNTNGATGHLLISGFSSWEFSEGSSGNSASSFNIVEIASTDSPYQVTGSEDVLLVDTTSGNVDIQLLPASNILSQKRVLWIKESEYQNNDVPASPVGEVYNVRLIPSGSDTIDNISGTSLLTYPVGKGSSVGVVSNKADGYNYLYKRRSTTILNYPYNYLAADPLLGGKLVNPLSEILYFQGGDVAIRMIASPEYSGKRVTIIAGTKLVDGAQVGCTVTVNTLFSMVGTSSTIVLTQGQSATFCFAENTLQEDSSGGGCWYLESYSPNVWVDLS